MRALGLVPVFTLVALLGAGDVTLTADPPVVPGLVALVNVTATPETLYELQFCGGVALSPTRVVTVTHCAAGRTPSNIAVASGATDLCDEAGMATRRVRAICPSPSNEELTELIFDTPLPGPFPQVAGGATEGTLSVHGWGKATGTGVMACGVKTISLSPISAAGCRSLPASGRRVEDPHVCCARPISGGGNTCQGDSGSPVYNTADDVVGFVLGGIGCGPQDDGVYARP